MTLLLFLFGLLTFPVEVATVTIEVTTTSTQAAPLRLAVFSSPKDFADDRQMTGVVKPLDGSVSFDLDLPAAGNYVFAAFQDLNDNGKLDKNFLGIPTEPYGFTETPPTKWRAPEFAEVASNIPNSGPATATINLKEWKDY